MPAEDLDASNRYAGLSEPCGIAVPQCVENIGLVLGDKLVDFFEGPEELILIAPFISEDPNIGTG